MQLFFNVFTLIFSIGLGIHSIAYGLYEIRQNKNKAGGIVFILFSLAILIFANIVLIFKS